MWTSTDPASVPMATALGICVYVGSTLGGGYTYHAADCDCEKGETDAERQDTDPGDDA